VKGWFAPRRGGSPEAGGRPGWSGCAACRCRAGLLLSGRAGGHGGDAGGAARIRWICCCAVTRYRVCRAAVSAAGAAVYDELGAPVRTGAGGYEPARREPAGAAPRG